jgi:aminopeptidase YwaD
MSSTDGTGIGTRQYGTTGNVMASEYLFTRLESYGLTVWYEDFLTPEGFLSTNVIGEIPGNDQSAIYGVMAHLDSTAADFSNAPGADDNATGMASALEIARILSAYSLKHPVHIIFVNAEETAIIGSMAYARQLVAEEVPMEGVFNIDSVGSALYGPRIVLNGDETSAWMMDLLVRVNDGYGLGQEILVRQNPAIVADDNMLRNEGIEAVMVARELFGESSIHHTSDDVIENVSIPLTVRTAQLVLLAIAALVQ